MKKSTTRYPTQRTLVLWMKWNIIVTLEIVVFENNIRSHSKEVQIQNFGINSWLFLHALWLQTAFLFSHFSVHIDCTVHYKFKFTEMWQTRSDPFIWLLRMSISYFHLHVCNQTSIRETQYHYMAHSFKTGIHTNTLQW